MENVIRANRVYRFLSVLVAAVILSSMLVDLLQATIDPIAWTALVAASALIAYAAVRRKPAKEPCPCEEEALPRGNWARPLTERQRSFVAGILAGKSAKEIAAVEGVKPATVYNALSKAYAILDVESNIELLARYGRGTSPAEFDKGKEGSEAPPPPKDPD
ncbi:MAG TPA: helix-turn-helix transcriptional regulator [Rectinemataceae bacterium]|nr:helix-turn-helix transcriptional regulator [Rectinemataceae bacterium]